MNKYFKVNETIYESVRNNMDKISGYPSDKAETWFTPFKDALKDKDGNVLIAAVSIIADQFTAMGVKEISKKEFEDFISNSQYYISPLNIN